MARGFIVAGTTGLAFRDSIPMLGAKSACDPFPPYRRLHLYDTSVEFVFLVSEDCGGVLNSDQFLYWEIIYLTL